MKRRVVVRTVVFAFALSVFLTSACAGIGRPRNIPSSLPSFGEIAVPNAVGLDIENALAEIGPNLVGRIRYDPKASPAGVVVRTSPPAGEIVPLTSIVDVVIGGDRGEPYVETGVDAGLSPMGELAGLWPEIFLGFDVMEKGPPVFVFNPGVNRDDWKDEMEWAARGRPYRTRSCPISNLVLRQVQAGVSLHDWWTKREPSYGIGIAPAKCQVWLVTDPLTPSERRALREAYGDLVWIDESGGFVPE